MFKRIKPSGFRFSTKLFLSYLLLCLVPIALIMHVYYNLAKERILETSTQASQMLASQLGTSLDIYMAQVNHASLTIYSDYELIDYLGRESSYSNAERIRLNLLLHRQLSSFMTQLPHLHGVALLAESGIVYTNGYLPDFSHQQAFWENWLQQIREANGKFILVPTHSQIYHPSGSVAGIFSAGRLVQDIEGRQAGILLFQLSPDRLVVDNEPSVAEVMPFRKRIVIEIPQQALIYDSDEEAAAFIPERRPLVLSADEWMLGSDQSGDFKVTVAVPMSELQRQIGASRRLTLLITVAVICAIMICSLLLSYQISKPISRLIRSMRQWEDGRHTPLSETGLTAELGSLTRTYNLMVGKIRHLIEDVYMARIKQDEARWLALQNQINPHWLYNTLESIRMQAYLSKAPDVAAMIKTLGRLFQMTLDTERQNTVEDELHHVKLYLELQNIRFENRFALYIELSESIRQLPLMKLTLQPLVENAIVHGFLDQNQSYTIRITGQSSGAYTRIFLADNGGGMTADRLVQLKDELASCTTGKPHVPAADQSDTSSSSIGLRNVHQRLLLHYGSDCGLTLDSHTGGGTCVTLTIPTHSKSKDTVHNREAGHNVERGHSD